MECGPISPYPVNKDLMLAGILLPGIYQRELVALAKETFGKLNVVIMICAMGFHRDISHKGAVRQMENPHHGVFVLKLEKVISENGAALPRAGTFTFMALHKQFAE